MMEGRQTYVALHRATQGIIYFQRNKFSRSAKIDSATYNICGIHFKDEQVVSRAVGSILKPVRLFSLIGMTLNLIIEEVVFLV